MKKSTKRQSEFEKKVFLRLKFSRIIPDPEREFRFSPPRRFRFDFAWPDEHIALECEGGVYIRGGHTRGLGYENDCEKYNLATFLGWRVFRYTPNMIDDIIPTFEKIFRGHVIW